MGCKIDRLFLTLSILLFVEVIIIVMSHRTVSMNILQG